MQQVDRNSTDSSSRRNAYNSFELGVTGRLPGGGNAFGGWTADRTIDVACDSRDNPNTLRFCDQSVLGMPFQHEIKLSVVQPLPADFQVGFTMTNWAGGPNGSRAYATPGGARWTGLSTNWSLSKTTRYAADCPGPCTPFALVIPTLTDTTLVVPLVAPGEEFTERFVQLGLQALARLPVRREAADDERAGVQPAQHERGPVAEPDLRVLPRTAGSNRRATRRSSLCSFRVLMRA